MKKKRQAQRGEKGSITTARGVQAMKARPGPVQGREGHAVPPPGRRPGVGHRTAGSPEASHPHCPGPEERHPDPDLIPALQGTARCFPGQERRT